MILGIQLADQPFHKISTMIAQIPHLIKLKSYLTVYQLVSLFIKDENLRKAFSFHPLLVGGSPLDTTSIYCLIHHVESEWGIWFPKENRSISECPSKIDGRRAD